jgi:predicted nuclease with RNAse H fold
MQRMAYLTLRGVSLTRCIETLRPSSDLSIVEVHPGATLALHGAPLQDVLQLKKCAAARQRLLHWLGVQGLDGITAPSALSDHYVAACAAALGAWKWSTDASQWRMPAQPPHHPYDFAS